MSLHSAAEVMEYVEEYLGLGARYSSLFRLRCTCCCQDAVMMGKESRYWAGGPWCRNVSSRVP